MPATSTVRSAEIDHKCAWTRAQSPITTLACALQHRWGTPSRRGYLPNKLASAFASDVYYYKIIYRCPICLEEGTLPRRNSYSWKSRFDITMPDNLLKLVCYDRNCERALSNNERWRSKIGIIASCRHSWNKELMSIPSCQMVGENICIKDGIYYFWKNTSVSSQARTKDNFCFIPAETIPKATFLEDAPKTGRK